MSVSPRLLAAFALLATLLVAGLAAWPGQLSAPAPRLTADEATQAQDVAASMAPGTVPLDDLVPAASGMQAGTATVRAPRRTSRVEIRLEEHGSPLSDLEIRLEGQGIWRAGRTDPEGIFRAELPVGEYAVTIPAREIETTVRAAEVETTTARLELPGTGWLAGRVVDSESGAPLAGAMVEVFPEEGPGENAAYARMGFFETDAMGAFRIDALPADRAVQVAVSLRTHAEHREVVPVGREIDVRLAPLGEFTVEVVDGRGRAVAARSIEVEIRGASGSAEVYEALLDARGHLLVTDLAAGFYRARVRIEGGSWSAEARAYASPERGVSVVLRVDEPERARATPDMEVEK